MTLTIKLSDEQAAALQAQAAEEGLTIDLWLQRLAEQQANLYLSASPPQERPICEVILENMKDVSRVEFEKLPKDGASENDHYLYGHPKRFR